jgi:hypothetical protein
MVYALHKFRHYMLNYWKQLENKQEMKHSRFMKWNNCINKQEITKVVCFKCYNHKTMACNY